MSRFVLSALFFCTLFAVSVSSAFPVTVNDQEDRYPVMSGRTLYWSQSVNGCYEIFALDRKGQRQITHDSAQNIACAPMRRGLVFTSGSLAHMTLNTWNGKTMVERFGGSIYSDIQSCGKIVVWSGAVGTGSPEIFMLDGDRSGPITHDTFRDVYPNVDRRDIVWLKQDAAGDYHVYRRHRGINENIAPGVSAVQRAPYIHSGRVVWAGISAASGTDYEIWTYSDRDGLENLSDNTGNDFAPVASRKFVAWIASTNNPQINNIHIKGDDIDVYFSAGGSVSELALSGNNLFFLCRNPVTFTYRVKMVTVGRYGIEKTRWISAPYSWCSQPRVFGKSVLWSANDGNDMEIYMFDGKPRIQTTGLNVVVTGTQPRGWPAVTGGVTNNARPVMAGGMLYWSRLDGTVYHACSLDRRNSMRQITDASTINDLVDASYGTGMIYRSYSTGGTTQSLNLYGRGSSRLISTGDAIGEVRTSGRSVAWTMSVPAGNNSDIYFFDGRKVTRITNDSESDFKPDIDRKDIAWLKGTGSVNHVHRFHRGNVENIAPNVLARNARPSISGGVIAWSGMSAATGSDSEIWTYSDRDGLQNLTDDAVDQFYPVVSRKFTVWTQATSNPKTSLLVFRAKDGQVYSLALNGYASDLVLSQSMLAFIFRDATTNRQSIYIVPVRGRRPGRAYQVSATFDICSFLSIARNTVVWSAYDGHDNDVYMNVGVPSFQTPIPFVEGGVNVLAAGGR